MKKIITLLTLLTFAFANPALSQDNELHGSEFWQTRPGVEELKAKIAEGNDPVALTSNAFDATVYAINNGAPIETIMHLLSLPGNEVNKYTHDGRNYLMWAAYRGNLELVEHLLKQGSKLDIIDDHGFSIIPFAANAGQKNPELYDMLLDAGVKLDGTNHDGANALLLLTPNVTDFSELDYFIEKGLPLTSKDDLGNTAFNYAAKKGNISIMNQLIQKGIDYKTLNKEGGNAMIYAGYGGRGHSNPIEVYQYLDELGIEANVVTTNGTNPLHAIAYRSKDQKIFDFFINKGVDINQADAEGNTVFLNAVSGGNIEIAKYIFPKVSDINHQNKDGYSALTFSVMNNQPLLFNFLVENGADIQVLDQDGNNLSYHAFQNYSKENVHDVQHFLTELQKNGVSLTETTEEGNTLYHVAVEENLYLLLNKASELGIDINQKNNDGLTPLHLAAMKAKDTKQLEWLLENGADRTITTDFEETVFDLANENEVLVESGVKLDFLK